MKGAMKRLDMDVCAGTSVADFGNTGNQCQKEVMPAETVDHQNPPLSHTGLDSIANYRDLCGES